MDQLYFRLNGALHRVAQVAVWIGGASLMVCAILVTGDVIMRKLFSITVSGSDEISGYAFAASTTWAYSYCLLHRANIRIDAVYNLFPNVVKAVLDLIGLLALLFFMFMLTRPAIDVLGETIRNDAVSNTTLLTPLWIPQMPMAIGSVVFAVALTDHLLQIVLAGDHGIRSDTAQQSRAE